MSQTNITAILADTKAHGFTFNTEIVKSDSQKYPAEVLIVQDTVKFETAFPGVIAAALNGSSIRVQSQAVSRNARGKLSPAQLRERNVKTVCLGIDEPTVREVEVFTFKGVRYATEEEMTSAVETWALSQLEGAEK